MKIPTMLLCELVKKFPGEVILDPEDYERFKLNKVLKQPGGLLRIYVKGEYLWLHKAVLGVTDSAVDHINRICWDNRKVNLRRATTCQNMQNIGKPITNTSGYKGVSWCKGSNSWHATIRCNKKRYYLGCFKTAELAHAAYRKKALELHGEFANFN